MRGQQGAVGWAELQVIHGPCEEVWAGRQRGKARGLPMRPWGHGRVGWVARRYVRAGLCCVLQDQMRPIHYASKGGHCEMVQQLLESKADVNAVGKVSP